MIHAAVKWCARASAIVGGLVLTALILLTTLSIIGRSLSKLGNGDWGQAWLGPLADWIVASGVDEIRGTYELTEAGVAFAIFAFLPICQFTGGHATVDVFTAGFSARLTRLIKAFWEVILTVTIIFVSIRLYEGMLRYLNNGETTLFLQFPVWWAYAAAVAASVVACVTAVYCAYARLYEVATGRAILHDAPA